LTAAGSIAQNRRMRFRQRLVVPLSLGALGFAAATSALAQPVDALGSESYAAPKATERDGFMIGLAFGYGYGSVAGYPNQVTKIDVPEYRSSVSGLASTSSLWLGAALRDWVTFGVGIGTASALANGGTGAGLTLGIRVEGYPLFALSGPGGFFRNLGLGLEMGAGTGVIIRTKQPKDPLAEGGSMASMAVSAFWEPLKFWHIAFGPALGYRYSWSDTLYSSAVSVGLRTAFYWDLPKSSEAKTPTQAAQSSAELRSVSGW
jgi:hypothetical protein